MVKKKKVFIHSDFALVKSGFGRNCRAVMTYLHNTGKYDLVNFSCFMRPNDTPLEQTPWKSIHAVPSDEQMNKLYSAHAPSDKEAVQKLAGYGAFELDQAINNYKPDVYIGIQDIWGVDFAIDKPWFKRLTPVIWTTLDSLPLFPRAVEKAKEIPNFWIWSDFATKEFHRLGYNHVKTVHGAVETKYFHPLPDDKKAEIRKSLNIPLDTFIVGFVFRNQLRKSVPNLMEGYALWKKANPGVKSALLLHTHVPEGWPIPKLAEENGIPKEEILTSYVCRACKRYNVIPYAGEEIDCPVCNVPKAIVTTNIGFGVTESQLNEIYNIMDVYCHPFTSGGQEIPIQEAKLAGLITLVTNYSCGVELCVPEAASLPLDWDQYREIQSNFIKATTQPKSICKQLDAVYKMTLDERKAMGLKARQWTIDNYSVENVCKYIEDFLDKAPYSDLQPTYGVKKDPEVIIENIPDNVLWLKTLYKKVLLMDVADNDSGLQHWLRALSMGSARSDIEGYFRNEAVKDNQKNGFTNGKTLEEFLDKDDKRILYVIPEGIGDVFLSTSLFKSIKDQYPEYNLYVATKPENFSVLEGNEWIHRVIPFVPEMNNLLAMEGIGDHKGYFDIAFLAHLPTQVALGWVHNGLTRIQLDLE